MPEIDLQSAIETNVLKLGTMTMEAHADRLVIVQDPFVSGYECTTCGGKQIVNDVSYVACEDCGGKGKRVRAGTVVPANDPKNPVPEELSAVEKKCSTCSGSGRVPCPDCDGKGGLIVVPDASERRPTTGTIVSVGESIFCPHCKGTGSIAEEVKPREHVNEYHLFTECKRCEGTGGSRSFERGQAVIYPSFAGHAYDLVAEDLHGHPVEITIVVLRESEVLAKIAGHLELRRVRKSAALGTAA